MKNYRGDTFADPRFALYEVARAAVVHGDRVSPRGMATLELRHVTMEITDTTACLPEDMGRRFNPRLAAYETLALLGGFASLEMAEAAVPGYGRFTGGGMTGAYGPRIMPQMEHVLDLLQTDPDTRQAVVTIWDPDQDLFREHGDRPCTTQLGFVIRGGQLITNTIMRSQDVFLGLPYDLVMFTQLHQTVARALGVEAGPLIHQVRSLHVYERNLDRVAELTVPPDRPMARLHGLEGTSWAEVIDRARQLAHYDVPLDDDSLLDETARWLARHMADVRAVVAHTRA